MNPKVAKVIVKQGFGLAVAALIGYAIKAEHRVEEKIDDHYDKKLEDQKTDE